jgi:hypothetical protein
MLIVVIAHSGKARLNGSDLATSRYGATSVIDTSWGTPPASVKSARAGDSKPVHATETLTKHSGHMIRVTEIQGVGDESTIKKHAQTARRRCHQ